MQTRILDTPPWNKTAKLLAKSRKHLQIQGMHCLQLYKRLISGKGGWDNYPLVIQWEPYVDYLPTYAAEICKQCAEVGFNMKPATMFFRDLVNPKAEVPHWIRNETTLARLIVNHRAVLAAKAPLTYLDWYTGVEPTVYWPVPIRLKMETRPSIQDQMKNISDDLDTMDEPIGTDDALRKQVDILERLQSVISQLQDGPRH